VADQASDLNLQSEFDLARHRSRTILFFLTNNPLHKSLSATTDVQNPMKKHLKLS
jgi:hypothetical protein